MVDLKSIISDMSFSKEKGEGSFFFGKDSTIIDFQENFRGVAGHFIVCGNF